MRKFAKGTTSGIRSDDLVKGWIIADESEWDVAERRMGAAIWEDWAEGQAQAG
jgi:hypothetical protein